MKKFMYVALLALGVLVMVAPPAVAQDDKPFVIHGEFRFRGEIQDNGQDFDDDNSDDSLGFWPYRARIAAEGHFGKNVGVWIEFQNAGTAGAFDLSGTTGGGPFRDGSDMIGLQGDGAELYQANVTLGKLWSDNFTLRLGRGELVAGNELHLGDLDFYRGVSHDGLVGTYDFGKVDLMGFYTIVSEGDVDFLAGLGGPVTENSVFGGSGSTTSFYGVYVTWAMKKHAFEAYALNLKTPDVEFDTMTIGGRYSSSAMKDNLMWNVEYAIQNGDAAVGVDAGGDVLEASIGYKFGKNHQIWGRIAQASGDEAGSADEDEGFQPLFQDFHNRLGRGDWFILGDANGYTGGGIEAWGIGYDGSINANSSWGAAYWDYSIAETAGDDGLGNAIDLHYDYTLNRNVIFTAAASQLSPDDGLVVDGDDARRIYGQVRVRF